ncbi:MAG: chromosome segregation protein SMC [Anaerolineales bacterium]|nr:chromosome segregation protein SMC [Anaerolineales bacterium]
MRLKSLELHGYKTFATQTLFEFAGAVTAIVGPNGSGKSNVADGLRWVLGEQTYSLMRAKKTEDMIYAGSQYRSRSGMASVTVVFDNQDGWLPIDYSEVAIARRAYRDGQNEYLLNKQRVRLRDISELLTKCGLAERTYTIIGQGLVDAALALKAEERRRLFEEAAGIGLYRSRREEALRRLDISQRNLDRVQDILAELEPRLKSLERQAKRAEDYEAVKSELRHQLKEWYGYHWMRLQKELVVNQEISRQKENELAMVRTTQDSLLEKLNTLRERALNLRHDLSQWHLQLSELHTRRESNGRKLAVIQERLRSIEEQYQQTNNSIVILEGEIEQHQERLESARKDKDQIHVELIEARKQAENTKSVFLDQKKKRQDIEADFQSARDTYQVLLEKKSRLNARSVDLQEHEKRLAEEVVTQQKQIETARSLYQSLVAKQQENEKHLEKARLDRKNLAHDQNAHNEQLTNLNAKHYQALEDLGRQKIEAESLKAKLEIIEQAERNLEGYAKGARLLLEAAREHRLEGIQGQLNTFMQVPYELEIAISAALGEFVDAIVFAGDLNIDSALNILENEEARGSMLSIDRSQREVDQLNVKQKKLKKSAFISKDVLGIAAELITSSTEFQPIVDFLLGNVLVVNDRLAALRVLDEFKGSFNGLFNAGAVTLSGEFFLAQGAIVAGRESDSSIRRKRRQQEILTNLKGCERKLISYQKQVDNFESEREKLMAEGVNLASAEEKALHREEEYKNISEHLNLEVKQADHQVLWLEKQRENLLVELSRSRDEMGITSKELSTLQEDILKQESTLKEKEKLLADLSADDLFNEVNNLETRIAVGESAYISASEIVSERESIVEKASRDLIDYQNRLKQIKETRSNLETEIDQLQRIEIEINGLISKQTELIEPAEQEIVKSEVEQKDLQNKEGESRVAVNLAEHHNAQAKLALSKSKEALESIRRRIEDDFGLVEFEYSDEISGPKPLPFEGLVEQLYEVENLSTGLEENLKRSRSLLKRIGPVNPEAQTEYLEVKERFNFLKEQLTDLRKAQVDIRQVIVELDDLMEKAFHETFESVAAEFRQIFIRLFGGGTARLVLTDPQDLTTSGIDIEARLPGRREQGLALLSGGERSLAAVALVFALLKVSPTPFCILDEVDAMLDESNVNRFSDLLKELSTSTQFIIITHNPNTLQVADVIYGVTMGKDSSSQVVSLKMDEYETVREMQENAKAAP